MKIDPFFIVYSTFDDFFGGLERVPYEKLKEFFGEFSSYFEADDMDAFLDEVAFIKRGDQDEIELNELASLIRDDVD